MEAWEFSAFLLNTLHLFALRGINTWPGRSVSKTCMVVHSEVEAEGFPSRQVTSASIPVFPEIFGDRNDGVSLVSERKMESQVKVEHPQDFNAFSTVQRPLVHPQPRGHTRPGTAFWHRVGHGSGSRRNPGAEGERCGPQKGTLGLSFLILSPLPTQVPRSAVPAGPAP